MFFFFFQAEDGIRDDLVTGVQTCALQILQCFPCVARSWRASSLRRRGNTAPRASVSAASACAFSFGEDERAGGAESCAEAFIMATRREIRTTRWRRHMCPPATMYGYQFTLLDTAKART